MLGLEIHWNRFGPPKTLRTDNGSEFKGRVLELCSLFGVRIINRRPKHPQTQGKVSDFILSFNFCFNFILRMSNLILIQTHKLLLQ